MIVGLLRHGSTAWNDEGRMQGRRDIPLSARGRAEVLTWRAPAASRRHASRRDAVVVEPALARGRDGRDPLRCRAATRDRADRDGLGRMGGLRPSHAAGASRRSVRAERGRRTGFPAAGRRKSARGARSRRALPGGERRGARSVDRGVAQRRAAGGAVRRHGMGHDRQGPAASSPRRDALVRGRIRRADRGARNATCRSPR